MYIFADKKYVEKFTSTKVIEPVSLKGQFPEIFDFRFFHESVGAPEYPWVAVQVFLKIRRDIRSSLVSLTPVANGKNLQSQKF